MLRRRPLVESGAEHQHVIPYLTISFIDTVVTNVDAPRFQTNRPLLGAKKPNRVHDVTFKAAPDDKRTHACRGPSHNTKRCPQDIDGRG